jgi:hypothetical protein
MAQARRMLQWFDVERTIAALKLEQLANLATAVEPILRSTWERGLAVALAAPGVKAAPPGVLVGIDADLLLRLATNEGLNIERIDWARRQAGELIQGVSMETRYAVRRIIEAAVARGTAPRETGKLLEAIVGLTNRDAQAVARYQATLVEAGTRPATVDRLVDRYGTRLLKHRAQMIARTETIRAANEGRRAVWSRNVQEGTILPERWEREWVAIVPSDGRTCPYCEEQDGQRAPIDGTYPDGSAGPPGHPLCRCTESLVRAGGGSPARAPASPAPTDDELDALDKYTQSWHGQLNRELRGGAPSTLEGTSQIISRLDALAVKGATSEPMVLYRGVGQGDPLASLDPADLRRLRGTITEELGFASTSTDVQTAIKFTSSATPLVLEIHVPAGTRMIDVMTALEKQLAADAAAGRVPSAAATESEFILARGYRFRVGEVEEGAFPSQFLGGLARHKLVLYLIP